MKRCGVRTGCTCITLALGLAAAPLAAQVPVAPVSDSVVHRPPALHYFFRSLLIPGWGQASLDRKLTGGLFLGFEGLAIGMTLKASAELHFLDRVDTATARSRRAERQDWIVLIAFNHLFAGLEAYVSAHLVDFPRDLHIRAIPGRRPGIGITLPIPH